MTSVTPSNPLESATAAHRIGADHVAIRPTRGWVALGLRDLWRYRELAYFIAWRDVKVRYKQTALGALWAILQPLLLMGVFTLFIGRFVPNPPNGIPYPVFAFTALVPWTFFAAALAGSAQSLIVSANLVSKVYFPRLILPLASAGSFLLDFCLSFVVLIIFMLAYGVTPGIEIVFIPLFALFALVAALSVGVWLSALNVRYRDFAYAVPFMVQIWLFLSPVAYSANVVGGGVWQFVYGLNPMAGVIEGFRWALLDADPPSAAMLGASIFATIVLLITGLAYFRRTERTFADVI